MRDERLHQLARRMLRRSLDLSPGDAFLVRCALPALPLARAIQEVAADLGVFPVLSLEDEGCRRLSLAQLETAGEAAGDFLRKQAAWEMRRAEDLAGLITIRAPENDQETAGLSPGALQRLASSQREVQDLLINRRRWVLMVWPTPGQAQNAGRPTEAYFNEVLSVCLLDYDRMHDAMEPLARLMESTREVRLQGPGTDLSFSIEGMPAVRCHGLRNLPDGEIYAAPRLDSLEGQVTYNVPSTFWGRVFRDVRLVFRKGRVVEASCRGEPETALLNRILDTDEGARSVGEFSLGVNPLIREPVGSTLFDEKIAGSFHLTPGSAYLKSDNGNRSAIHWDLVCIQRPEYGGGEIRFDGRLVRKDGLFVPEALRALNPDQLLA